MLFRKRKTKCEPNRFIYKVQIKRQKLVPFIFYNERNYLYLQVNERNGTVRFFDNGLFNISIELNAFAFFRKRSHPK